MNETPGNTLEVPARLESICQVIQTVTTAARKSGMTDKNIWKLETSLDEALTNIVCYGYKNNCKGTITIRWTREGDDFVVTLEDCGIPFDQTQPTHPDFDCDICQREVGGLGRFIMAQFLDRMSYVRKGNCNCLTLVKHLVADSEHPSISLAG